MKEYSYGIIKIIIGLKKIPIIFNQNSSLFFIGKRFSIKSIGSIRHIATETYRARILFISNFDFF